MDLVIYFRLLLGSGFFCYVALLLCNIFCDFLMFSYRVLQSSCFTANVCGIVIESRAKGFPLKLKRGMFAYLG